MTTAPRTNSWKGIMRRAGAAAVEQLEGIAAMDQPASKVSHIRPSARAPLPDQSDSLKPPPSSSELEAMIQAKNNRLVQLSVEFGRVYADMIDLQKQLIGNTKSHMWGWEIDANLKQLDLSRWLTQHVTQDKLRQQQREERAPLIEEPPHG